MRKQYKAVFPQRASRSKDRGTIASVIQLKVLAGFRQARRWTRETPCLASVHIIFIELSQTINNRFTGDLLQSGTVVKAARGVLARTRFVGTRRFTKKSQKNPSVVEKSYPLVPA